MRQNTHASPSCVASVAVAMYSPRHPAHSRSSMGGDLGEDARDEVLDSHAPLGLLVASRVDADGASGNVVVADHEDVGDLLQLRGPDTGPELVGRILDVGPQPL